MYTLSEHAKGWLLGWCRAKFKYVIAKHDFEAPDFWLVKYYHKQGTPRVFAGGECDDTIFSGDRGVQYAYRAWHDAMHIQHSVGFSHEEELKLAWILKSEMIRGGCRYEDADLVYLDLTCHIRYHQQHGEHPTKQLQLISDIMDGLIILDHIPPAYH